MFEDHPSKPAMVQNPGKRFPYKLWGTPTSMDDLAVNVEISAIAPNFLSNDGFLNNKKEQIDSCNGNLTPGFLLQWVFTAVVMSDVHTLAVG